VDGREVGPVIRRRWIVLGVAALGAALWAGVRPAKAGDALPVGGPAPAVLAGRGTPVTVAWIVGEKDWLTCRPPTRELRRALARHGARVEVVAVSVGTRPRMLHAFFRRERLAPRMEHLTEAEYRRVFGRAPLPALYVVADGRIVGAMAGPETGGAVAMQARVERVMSTADAAVRRGTAVRHRAGER
jgi:hypothetical protein